MKIDTSRTASANTVMHRLQIGIGGLVAILALVGLADMLLEGASNERAIGSPVAVQQGETVSVPPGVDRTTVEPQASEPLVELGVVPDLPVEEGAAKAPATAAPAVPGQVVPDLPAPGQTERQR
ncbi:MAG: hypothetical protein R3E02_09330 [Blastomonas sp.]